MFNEYIIDMKKKVSFNTSFGLFEFIYKIHCSGSGIRREFFQILDLGIPDFGSPPGRTA
jgi:hypothetical protein